MLVAHKYLYERGILHRDISPGNILIKWQAGSEGNQPSTTGCLIDLDHGKRGKPLPKQVTSQRPVDDDDLDEIVLVWCSKKNVKTDVERQALAFFPATDNDNDNVGPIITYLMAAVGHALKFRPLNGQLCTLQHLGWQSVWPHCSPFLQL